MDRSPQVEELTGAPELEEAACPLRCDAPSKRVLSGRDELYGAPGEFQVWRCAGCGILRTSPRPTPHAIGRYYPDDYGPYLSTEVAPAARSGGGKLRHFLRSLIRYQSEEVPPLAPGRMLELGCASGAFLKRMQALGWSVEGIEFSESAAERARSAGFEVQVGTVEGADVPSAAFDLIVAWMVIEHLHRPLDGLVRVAQWAKPGAWLCVSVPNAGAYEFKLFGRYWYALHLPNHLHHFSAGSLARLLAAAGWRVERVLYQRSVTNVIGSLGIWLRSLGTPGWLHEPLVRFPDRSTRWSIALYPLAWILSQFGQTGRMTVWARKA